MGIKNILIVDDSRTSRMMLSRMLQRIDEVDITTANSAEEAIEYLNGHYPDAIFMDHSMPGMDGLQAVKVIKNNPQTAAIPIAMFTSKEGEDYLDQVKNQGAVGILYKPSTPKALREIVQDLNDAYVKIQREKPAKAPAAEPQGQKPCANKVNVSAEAIDNLVRVSAVSFLNDAIKAQIMPFLEDKLARFREDILNNSEQTIQRMADQLYTAHQDELSQKIDGKNNDQILEEVEDNIQTLKNHEVNFYSEIQTVVDSFLSDKTAKTSQIITEQIEKDVTVRLSVLEQQLREQLDDIRDDVDKTVTKFNPETLESILNTVKYNILRTNESARETARKVAQNFLDKFTAEFAEMSKSLMLRMYILAGLAVVISIVASVVITGLGQSG
jgi:CheY-like chemotaxis protein